MKNKKVLWVEDSKDEGFFIKRCFKKLNLLDNLILIDDAEKAIRFLDSVSDALESPFLIILDLKLPKISGVELAKIIRSKEMYRYTPIIIVSSSNHPADIESSYRAGANAYLTKGMGMESTFCLVEAIVNFWLKFVESP